MILSQRILLCAIALLVVALSVVGITRAGYAQELNCRVNVDYSQISGADYAHLSRLGRVVEEYLNERRWTDDRFSDVERIDCNFQITFTQADGLDRFRARLSVGARRPIYGTNQFTHVFQLIDNEWHFQYVENQSLLFDLNRFDSFTAVLNFYAYVILGYDYDTFSEFGGTPHFERARRIAELASTSGAAGWSLAGTDRSRMALITQILDPRMRPLRQAYYRYHFTGLDHFTSQTNDARSAVLGVIESLKKLYDDVSRQYAIDLFFTTKYQELVAVFNEADERRAAYSLLMQVDPSHSSVYDRLAQ